MKTNNKCSICGRTSGGIIVNGKTICNSCETNIINLEPTNDFYDYYKNAISKIFDNTSQSEKYKLE